MKGIMGAIPGMNFVAGSYTIHAVMVCIVGDIKIVISPGYAFSRLDDSGLGGLFQMKFLAC